MEYREGDVEYREGEVEYREGEGEYIGERRSKERERRVKVWAGKKQNGGSKRDVVPPHLQPDMYLYLYFQFTVLRFYSFLLLKNYLPVLLIKRREVNLIGNETL